MAKCHKKCYHFTGKAKWWLLTLTLRQVNYHESTLTVNILTCLQGIEVANHYFVLGTFWRKKKKKLEYISAWRQILWSNIKQWRCIIRETIFIPIPRVYSQGGALWKKWRFTSFQESKKCITKMWHKHIFSHAIWSKLFTKFHQESKSCENPLQQHATPKRSITQLYWSWIGGQLDCSWNLRAFKQGP